MIDIVQLQTCPRDDIPRALAELGRFAGEVERVRAVLWSRIMAETPAAAAEHDTADDHILTVAEVAERLKTSERWVRAHRRELKGFGTRRALRFRESALRVWERKNQK